MNITPNARLFDITMRQQMYIEGVKLNQLQQFNKCMIELLKELKILLPEIRYSTLDQMTKTELNVLLVKIRRFQNRIYSQYTQALVDQLQAFMRADVRQTKRLLTSFSVNLDLPDDFESEEVDDSDADDYFDDLKDDGSKPLFGWLPIQTDDAGFNKFWALMLAAPIPGNGVLINSFIRNFSISAQASIENLIRQAYVNGWTVTETLDALINQVGRVNLQAAAVTGTLFQHVAAQVSAGVASAPFGKYKWVSVMDSRTSSICRDRNGHVYLFGFGPLPPAHLNCRSHVTYLNSDDDESNPSLYNWLSNQPLSFLATVLTPAAAAAFVSGKAKASDYEKFTAVEPLSIEEFSSKDQSILTN